MLFTEMPDNFSKRFDVVGCFVEHNGKFLLLRRQSHKPGGGTWGLPAGKVDADETIMSAILREAAEETGLKLAEAATKYSYSRYVRGGDLDFEWHAFGTKLDTLPKIEINPLEHSAYRWVTPREALQMDLIYGLPESIELFYSASLSAQASAAR